MGRRKKAYVPPRIEMYNSNVALGNNSNFKPTFRFTNSDMFGVLDSTKTLPTFSASYLKERNDTYVKLMQDVYVTLDKETSKDSVVNNRDMYNTLGKTETNTITTSAQQASYENISGLYSKGLDGAGLLRYVGYEDLSQDSTRLKEYGLQIQAANQIINSARVEDSKLLDKGYTTVYTDDKKDKKTNPFMKAALNLTTGSTDKTIRPLRENQPVYKLDVLNVEKALVAKYAELGNIQEGTKDGEGVLFQIDTGKRIVDELAAYEKNQQTIGTSMNKDYDRALTESGTITQQQDVYLSQEAYNKAVLYNIYTQANTVGGKQSSNYQGNNYMDTRTSNDLTQEAPSLI
jgi:hypothetical protein